VNRFTPQTLPTVKRKHSLRTPFALSLLAYKKKTNNRKLLFGSILLKHGCHFDYWTQTLNMRTRVCYLNCHEAGLCCYLFFLPLYSPIQALAASMKLSFSLQLLNLGQLIGLLGRVISSSQGITYITAVLLPFVTYLLSLPRIFNYFVLNMRK
jgi:hypothetical protein